MDRKEELFSPAIRLYVIMVTGMTLVGFWHIFLDQRDLALTLGAIALMGASRISDLRIQRDRLWDYPAKITPAAAQTNSTMAAHSSITSKRGRRSGLLFLSGLLMGLIVRRALRHAIRSL